MVGRDDLAPSERQRLQPRVAQGLLADLLAGHVSTSQTWRYLSSRCHLAACTSQTHNVIEGQNLSEHGAADEDGGYGSDEDGGYSRQEEQDPLHAACSQQHRQQDPLLRQDQLLDYMASGGQRWCWVEQPPPPPHQPAPRHTSSPPTRAYFSEQEARALYRVGVGGELVRDVPAFVRGVPAFQVRAVPLASEHAADQDAQHDIDDHAAPHHAGRKHAQHAQAHHNKCTGQPRPSPTAVSCTSASRQAGQTAAESSTAAEAAAAREAGEAEEALALLQPRHTRHGKPALALMRIPSGAGRHAGLAELAQQRSDRAQRGGGPSDEAELMAPERMRSNRAGTVAVVDGSQRGSGWGLKAGDRPWK